MSVTDKDFVQKDNEFWFGPQPKQVDNRENGFKKLWL